MAAEPVLDFSEIIALYKLDALQSVERMRAALGKWDEVASGGPARLELRKISHQIRGSGRTYGFGNATRLGKAMERVVEALEKNRLQADERVQRSLVDKVERLAKIFVVPG